MKILVTGGLGFIGTNLIKTLCSMGMKVTILDNLDPKIHPHGILTPPPEGVRLIIGDVRNPNAWELALKGQDVVIHLAAYQDYVTDFGTFFDVNVTGTALLYESILKNKFPIKKVLISSSQAVYGLGTHSCTTHNGLIRPTSRQNLNDNSATWDFTCHFCGEKLICVPSVEHDPIKPYNAYGLSKYSQEQLGMQLGRLYEIPTTILRLGIVVGAYQSPYNLYSGAVRSFCLSYLVNCVTNIYEDGKQMRDYINVKDIVQYIVSCLYNTQTNYEIFNVSGNKVYTTYEVAKIIQALSGSIIEPHISQYYRNGDVRHAISNNVKINDLLGAPQYTFEEGVNEYFKWISDHLDKFENLRYNTIAVYDKMKNEGIIHGR